MTFPIAGHSVIDHSANPPVRRVVGAMQERFVLVGLAAITLWLVINGTVRKTRHATIGWILLAVLVAFSVSR